MRFHLVYRGRLSGSGNKSKPKEVAALREHLHPQLQHLWATHNALKVLESEGAVKLSSGTVAWADPSGPNSPREIARRFPGMYKDCLTPLEIGERRFMPLVRESLGLTCELKILFLRQADPGALVSQGGDIDNRIKLLLDALRVPSREELAVAPHVGDVYCLMESDHLVSRLDVDTDRLLCPETGEHNEVHLVIEVKLNALRVGPHNMCLL